MKVHALPTGLPALAAFAVGMLAFAIALIAARRRRDPRAETGGRRSRASWAGILIQGFALFWTAIGPIALTLDPLGRAAIGLAVAVALLMTGAVALFAWATATMGRNWSIVARTRGDHRLVTQGPFAHVRHPIYVAMAMILAAIAIAYGHEPRLIVGLPLFAIGTWLRIREEERLLGETFGTPYAAYAAQVKRFVPRLF